MTDPHAALDRGFATLARVGGAGGRPLEPDVVLAHAARDVANNPDDAAAAIFAAVVESSEGEAEAADLSWLYDEWKRRKRDEIDSELMMADQEIALARGNNRVTN
jgi:hypothetical protein